MCQIIFSSSYKLSTLFLGKYTLLFGLCISDSLAEGKRKITAVAIGRKGFFELTNQRAKAARNARGKPCSSPVRTKHKPNTVSHLETRAASVPGQPFSDGELMGQQSSTDHGRHSQALRHTSEQQMAPAGGSRIPPPKSAAAHYRDSSRTTKNYQQVVGISSPAKP